METALVEKLIDLVDERTVFRAVLGAEEDFEEFVRAVDAALGEGAYWTILQLSDAGRWRDVFRFVAAGRPGRGEDQ
ncbi:hypothetical protein ACIA5A_30705 [Micromonospora sp. NPDC051300]|uniref:hypothetical protein n=1 Tax=Micromonospora sp. NPDC051300 TaxID=3364286 RepID=UPI0037B7FD7E